MPPKKSGGGKKKKVVSNRGFSTVSIPRKKDPEEPESTEIDPSSASSDAIPLFANGAAASGEEGEGAKENGAAGGEGVKEELWESPEAVERHELQLLADKIRPTSEKEVARVTKVLEYERRLAKTYPYYAWTEQDLQKRILALALASSEDDVPQPLDELEDKVVAKVATLWGVLEQLGCKKERMQECLTSVKTLELEDCLDWLFLHCDAEELACEGPIVPVPPLIESIPVTPRPERESPTSPSDSPSAASKTPSSSTPKPELSEAAIEASLRARILSYDTGLDDDAEPEQSLEEQGANVAYAGLKLQLSEVQRAQGAAKRGLKGKAKDAVLEGDEAELMEAQVGLLKKKIKAVEGDYTFRKVDAEKLYREERVKLDAAQLAERLNGVSTEEATPESTPEPTPTTTDLISSQSTDTPLTSNDADTTTSASSPTNAGTETPASSAAPNDKGSEDADGDGDMFGALLDEMPTEETNDLGTTIPVRDMALPKHYSGKTPKTNLEETVRKADKYATVVFKRLGTSGSRAVRAAVSIRWDRGRTQTFEMQDAACYDQAQAFNYIATVALFAVSQTAVNKQLPLVFRDLWDELVAEKKETDDEAYRGQLKMFKEIAEPRLQPSPSRDPRVAKATVPAAADSTPPSAAGISPEGSERIKQELALRQSWPSYQEMLQQRAQLPIASYRSLIMQTIESSQCVVLCGETGCGKSTQLPSFILEHDMRRGRPVKIYCTEPRRISAISLAQRVSSELGESSGACGGRNSLVGYSIRLDSRVSPSSKIVYATTGIVLRMLEGRESLADLTHIIIDEVHERSIDSDFLLIVLREILETRKDLKVILMSATVDAEKISAYMGGCPVITVPGRTFPVTSSFLEDVVEITRYRLEPTTDSPYVSRKMRNHGGRARKSDNDDVPPDDDDEDSNDPAASAVTASYSKQTKTTIECMDHYAINFDLIVSLLEHLCFYKPELVPYSAATLIFMPSLESIRRLSDMLESHPAFGTRDFLVLPLHSTISNENQSVVFNVPPPGVRKIVISTNLAETGVTIPDITAVIDTGMHREMRFDEKRQISRLVQTFVAQSNAAQRRGRAGRVQEGVCFHLFTRQRHDTVMAPHPQPEMMRLSLQDLALRIKIMKIGNGIEDVLSKALDPPLVVNVQRAIASLIEAKALTTLEEITPLGRHLAKLPMDVHLGKFLIMACLFGCLDAALTITAALNSKSPWLTPFGRESEADAVKRSFKVENSDFMTTYNAYCSWREASGNGRERGFTQKSFLSQQNLAMMEELRQQYFSFLVDAGFIQVSEAEKRELISTRYGKSRTRFVRVPAELDICSRDPKAVTACLAASMYPKLLVVDPQNGQLRTLANSAPAAIHPSSVNFAPGRRIDFGNARFIAFFTAMHTKKLYVWESGSVDERAVYLLCGNSDFQLPAHSLVIDRKIKVQLEPKTVMAIKILRQRFNSLFMAKMKNPTVTTESQQQWLDLVKEALVSKPDEVTKTKKKPDAAPVKLSLVSAKQ